jgi:glycosyltransferase involved in cell wall biosynthesis
MKVLSIVYNEITNDNRVLNQAISLKNNGWDVTLLGIRIQQNLPLKERWEGIPLRRIDIVYKNPLIHRIPFFKPLFHYLNLYIRFLFVALKYDIIHCHDLNTLQFGTRVKYLKGKKVQLIYDAHEYETERNGLNPAQKRKAKNKERKLIKYCDRVITVSDKIADEYVRLYGIKKPLLILNCPILRSKEIIKKNLFRAKFKISNSKLILLYQGYLYPGRGIEIVLEAFTRLNPRDQVLIFMGEGNLEDVITSNQHYNKSVFLHPFVKGDVLLHYTSSADCGIAFIEDISLSDRYCLPNKLFEYIGAGLPVIGSGLPEISKFINGYKVGLVAQSNDIDGFIEAMNGIELDDPELLMNIKHTRKRFNWSTQEAKLLELYNSLSSK